MSDFQLFIDAIKSDPGEIENTFNIEFLEMQDTDLWRPLHHACFYGRVELVKLLLSNNCEINSFTNNGYQPIHLACENSHIDIVQILIANKCVINKKIKILGYQPIHFACENGHIDIVKILIAKKCDINAADKNGYQPIHLACVKGQADIVEILIANKCDVNISDKFNGYQPIHLACENGHIDVVKILIDNKCDINAADNIGYQPIHFACEEGHIDIVKILIANQCNMNVTIMEESLFDIAIRKGHHQIIDILINANSIEWIAKAMDLQCKIGCDHIFCHKSLENKTFKKGVFIGSGAFGYVYKQKISNTNREIVIKHAKNNCEDKKNIEGNINKYSYRIRQRNIIRYFGALEKSGKLYIFMEYMPGGSLKDLIDKSKWIENSKVIKFSKQILYGLQFIHSQDIIHRDIKPDNILLECDETLKLADFGLGKSLRIASTLETTTQAKTFCGTPNYMAPEILCDELYNFAADIWSTGASIVHMITGKIPYHRLLPEAVMFRIRTTKKIEFTPVQPISKTMQSFIDDLLTPEQSNRPNAESLLKNSVFEDVK